MSSTNCWPKTCSAASARANRSPSTTTCSISSTGPASTSASPAAAPAPSTWPSPPGATSIPATSLSATRATGWAMSGTASRTGAARRVQALQRLCPSRLRRLLGQALLLGRLRGQRPARHRRYPRHLRIRLRRLPQAHRMRPDDEGRRSPRSLAGRARRSRRRLSGRLQRLFSRRMIKRPQATKPAKILRFLRVFSLSKKPRRVCARRRK
jgi:hypothetical protein